MSLFNTNIQPLTYIPRSITNTAMLTYVLALVACNVVFSQYPLPIQYWAFGIVEVCVFFYFANDLSKQWHNISPRQFTKKVFWTALALRVAFVIFTYWLYNQQTGTPFSVGAADELYYNEAARYVSHLLREGQFDIYPKLQAYGDAAFSDMGYPIYLGIVYFLSGDSILVARLVKAIWGAWTAVLIYKLAMRNFGDHTARIAAILCVLMPNLIYYCSFQLKEVEMVFLATLFAERADYVLQKGKLVFWQVALLMLLAAYMFMIRTALGAVLVLAFMVTLLLSSTRVVSWGKRILLILAAGIFIGVILLNNTAITQDVRSMAETGASEQKGNMEWRSTREGKHGRNQSFAKYAGAAVFAPMIFTIPFPTMTDTPGQENQKMIHGGNFCKNITSFFTILALFILLFTGDWRRHVLPISLMCGYLVVLAFSNFAQSERFHQPTLPFAIMFAAYAISYMNNPAYKRWFKIWCAVMFVAALAWNWFKLAGRGMI